MGLSEMCEMCEIMGRKPRPAVAEVLLMDAVTTKKVCGPCIEDTPHAAVWPLEEDDQ